MMKRLARNKWIRLSGLGVLFTSLIGFVVVSGYAAALASKVYMRDKNAYFVLDASRDNFLKMNPLADLANAQFQFHKLIIKQVSWLIEQSYNFDLYQLIEKQFNTLFEPIKNTFWTGLFPVAGGIFILSLIFLLTCHGRASTAFEGFFKGMAIITFALWFMRSPANSMSYMKYFTDGVNGELIANTYHNVKVEDQYKEISDQFYNSFVVEVWRILNFSSVGLDNENVKVVQEKYEAKLLNALPGTDQRDQLTEELRAEVKISEGAWIGSLFLIMLLSIPDLLIVFMLSGINLASDVFTIGLALMAPVIFIFAIVPNYGARIFMSWLSKIMFFFAITIATTLMLTYYIGISNILLENRSSLGGIVGVYVVKDAILVAAFIFRDKLAFTAKSAVQGRRGMERSMEEMTFKKEAAQSKQSVITKAGDVKEKAVVKYKDSRAKVKREQEKERLKTNGISPVLMTVEDRNKLVDETLEAKLNHRMVAAKNVAVEKEKQFGIHFEPDYGDMAAHIKRYESGEDPFTMAERQKLHNDIALQEQKFGNPRAFIDKYKVDFARMNAEERTSYAKDYLQRKYEVEKADAEESVKGTEEAPKYNPWVQAHINRTELGEELFTDAEISDVADGIESIEQKGVSAKKVLKKRKTVDHIRPDEKSENLDDETDESPSYSSPFGGGVHSKPEDINIHHNHNHQVHYDTPPEAKETSPVDIRQVGPKGNKRTGGSNQTDDKRIDNKAAEAVMNSLKEVHKMQQEDKKDTDEIQEHLKELQRQTERQNRTMAAKLNKLEGERGESEKEETE